MKLNQQRSGKEMLELIKDLYPICRSITGDGVRKSLEMINRYVKLEIIEVPTGTQVFDWTVPKEWNITDAYIVKPNGERIACFKDSNLHVVSYSVQVKKKMGLNELREHLHSLPEQPDVIPYRTSYYKENWGFCISHKELLSLPEGEYEVFIDSSLEPGSLIYGEYYKKGRLEKEILLSTYLCHPSLCNDNLSGPALLAYLAASLAKIDTKYSYRFLFIPETIGAIAWLCKNKSALKNVVGGYVATCVGDAGSFTYRRSRDGEAYVDKVALQVLRDTGREFRITNFDPSNGSDERQFSSPAFNIPMGSIMRSQYGNFPEYHNSGDDLSLMSEEALTSSYMAYLDAVNIIESDAKYLNVNPEGEPQLGKRGLYRDLSSPEMPFETAGLFWVLNLSDGVHSLLDIASRSGLHYGQIRTAADHLLEAGLIGEITT